VAYEAVVVYREPSQPNPGCNETDAARSVRCKVKNVDYELKTFWKRKCQDDLL